tara:strand:+ start:9152 stop:10216 length:1065 start_codon:yes stop_codon:yes gene_type:complete
MVQEDIDVGSLLPADDENIFEGNIEPITAASELEEVVPDYSFDIGVDYSGGGGVQGEVDRQAAAIQGAQDFEGYTPMGQWDISPFGDFLPGTYDAEGNFVMDENIAKEDYLWHDENAPYTMYKSDETGDYSIIDPKTGALVPLEGSSATGGSREDDLEYRARDKFEGMLATLEKEKDLSRGQYDDTTYSFQGDTSYLSDEEVAQGAGVTWDEKYMDEEDLANRGLAGENISLSSELNFSGSPGMSLQEYYTEVSDRVVGKEGVDYPSTGDQHKLAMLHEYLGRQGINVTEDGMLEYANFGKQFKHSRGGRSTLGMEKEDVPTFMWQGKEYHTRTQDEVDIINKLKDIDNEDIFK